MGHLIMFSHQNWEVHHDMLCVEIADKAITISIIPPNFSSHEKLHETVVGVFLRKPWAFVLELKEFRRDLMSLKHNEGTPSTRIIRALDKSGSETRGIFGELLSTHEHSCWRSFMAIVVPRVARALRLHTRPRSSNYGPTAVYGFILLENPETRSQRRFVQLKGAI